jgi:D-alanyl-lipoteichoic acid acyltransferase DltB (MBOAT superfamily)
MRAKQVNIFSKYRSTFLKLLLCLAGFFLLGSISGSIYTVAAFGVCAILSYSLAYFLDSKSEFKYSKVIGRITVPLALLSIVLLNMTGLIGTLTGSVDGTEQSYSLLLAAPFYFLSAAAFIADVALRKLPLPSFLDYLTYLSLPFKLLAGPLELPRLLVQIKNWSPRFTWWRFSAAWPWVALGAFMKFVIANRLSPSANIALTSPVPALITASVFELKFYFDFAGYSFMGYGGALACGLRINQNFAHPFFAPNVVMFWRRWHMSLGRFLSRYILEPNLSLFSGRKTKTIFASCIFLVSALWHGGTGNYILWGLFHGSCYFIYVQYLKRKNIYPWAALMAMLSFFVMGRFLAIDSDAMRLMKKIIAIICLPFEGGGAMQYISSEYYFSISEIKGLVVAAGFLMLEAISLKKYSINRAYHLFRKPIPALVVLLMFLIFGLNSGLLLYARI